MSTHAQIAFCDKTTLEIASIYCHFNGYLGGIGKVLLEHWSDPAKLRKLIAQGGLTGLGKSLRSTEYFSAHIEQRKFASIGEWFEKEHEEYMYLFLEETKTWLVRSPRLSDTVLIPLTPELIEYSKQNNLNDGL